MKTLAYSEQAILQKFAPQLKLTTSGKPYFIAKEGMLTDEEIKNGEICSKFILKVNHLKIM